MKNYEKPIIIANNELAEGVYAASGEGDCWTITVTPDQEWNGTGKTFRVICEHISMQHISLASTMVITFNKALAAATFEGFSCTVDGNCVRLVRDNHANAYTSHDEFNSLLVVTAAGADTENESRGLSVIDKSIVCTKTTNVQGGGADGN